MQEPSSAYMAGKKEKENVVEEVEGKARATASSEKGDCSSDAFPKELQNDEENVRVACSQNGLALAYASEALKNDKDIVLVACSQNGKALKYASIELKNDKDIVLAACSQNGFALEDASEDLKNDKEIVLTVCSHSGYALQNASKELKNDKEVVLVACSQDGPALEYASEELKNDKDIVLAACSEYGRSLKYASEDLKNDKEIALVAFSENGRALEYASEELKNDKEIVLAACSKDGRSLRFASDALRGDKDVVMTALATHPLSLKFALGGLNQDKDCLIEAGLWDSDHSDRITGCKMQKKIVLSTKFSLAAESSYHATEFTLELKQHHYIKGENFLVYSPNAFNKGTCDPNWTDYDWPCRGTYDSCQKPPNLKTGVPQESECCWRYSFRHHLREAAKLGGFMIQVVDLRHDAQETPRNNYDHHTLGDGQAIETEMALDEGVKIFRFFEPPFAIGHSYSNQVDALVSQVQLWYRGGCQNMEECNVQQNRNEIT